MLDQLKTLEQTILDVRKQYHINTTELVNLKEKNKVEANQYTAELADELTKTKAENEQLQSELNSLDSENKTLFDKNKTLTGQFEQVKSQLTEQIATNNKLQTGFQSLQQESTGYQKDFESMKMQHQELLAEIEELKKINNTLLEKNRVAAEHTKLALQKLSHIDKTR